MPRRLFLLAGLCALLGVATTVFGAEQKQAPWITREGAVAMLVESKPEWRVKLDAARALPQPLPIYDDTDPNQWYIPYLEVGFAEGLIEATDFHRDFRPGQLLKQGEAIALAVRYKANGDASKIPQEEPDHPLSIALHVQAGYDMGLRFPSPFQSWNVIRRSDWYALAASAGVANPAAIVVTIPIVQPLPVAGPIDLVPVPSLQPIFPQPSQTGYKPDEPIFAPQQPAYVSNPPGSSPISSDGTPAVSQPSSDTASSGPVGPGTQFTITIPTLGKSFTVTHPTDVVSQAGLLAPLQVGLGHLFSYPGQGGSILVYGHSSSVRTDTSEYTKAFREINKLNPGDRIMIAYGGKTYTYEVTFKQTVDATDMSAYQKQNGEELILYTCWPPDDVKQRYLVHAKPI